MPETFGVCQQFRIGFGYGFVLISGACPCPMSSSPLSTRLNATRRDSTRLDSNPQSVVNFLGWLLVRGLPIDLAWDFRVRHMYETKS